MHSSDGTQNQAQLLSFAEKGRLRIRGVYLSVSIHTPSLLFTLSFAEMLNSLLFQASNPGVVVVCQIQKNSLGTNIDSQRSLFSIKPLRLPQPLCSLSLQSPQTPSHYTSTVGSSSPLNLSSWNLTHRHLTLLNVFACTTAICATWLFCSAIPALLAFKQAAESLEKLMDATREELPDTMAAIRLSGMEISDLTTELSDLGQEITQGVRSSTRAVRLAEQRLRRLTSVPPSAFLQEMTSPKPEPDPVAPALARSVRGVKEGIVKGRAFFQMFFSLTRFWRFAFNYMTRRK